jgi:hypothetical protein
MRDDRQMMHLTFSIVVQLLLLLLLLLLLCMHTCTQIHLNPCLHALSRRACEHAHARMHTRTQQVLHKE